MVREELVEGLKYAISKGESLPRAMMSFYNAGYLKKDIEEAARFLQSPHFSQTPITAQPPRNPAQPQPVKRKLFHSSSKPVQQPVSQSRQPVVQRVSAYEKKPKKRGGRVIWILSFFLLLLLGVLIAVFLFRDKLAEILGSIL